MGAAKVSTDAVSDLLGAEQPCGLDNGALAMDPLGFDGIEPRALDGQEAGQEAHPLPLPLDVAVVRTNPGPHALTDVPGGLVPDQDPHPQARLLQLGAAPAQELLGKSAHGSAIDEAQPHALALSGLAQQRPIARQRLGVGIALGNRLFDQAQWTLARLHPAVRLRLGHATPPGLVDKAQRPVAMLSRHSNQAVTPPFFRRYPGSGLVIQCLARFQPMPSRCSVARMVSPVTRVAVNPWAKLTSAAHSSVHRLLGLPKRRGLWCNSARNPSACAGPNAAGRRRLGRDEPLRNAGRPWALKACKASSTVWSSQPRCAAIRGARSPRALASRIWQRRSTKASGERRPAVTACRSASVSGRTKIGGLIPTSV